MNFGANPLACFGFLPSSLFAALKKSYVDVFNPSGAAPKNEAAPILAPSIPTMPNQSNFFIPPSMPAANDAKSVSV